MWQFYSLGSLVAGALESTADKAGIVKDGAVDSYVASFYRAFFFLIATTLVGLSGLLGDAYFFFHWSFILLGVIVACATILFTYLLRTVEVTVIGAASYLAPFLFLVIDTKILGIDLTQLQLIGIVLLVSGGLAFTLDGKTHHFRKNFGWKIWGALFYIFVFTIGVEAYLFKYLNATYSLNAVSYYTSSTIYAAALLFMALLATRKIGLLFSRNSRAYIPYALLGKSFDAFNSILYMMALTFASLSQASAFNALMPLAVICVALIAQGVFRIRLRERLDVTRTGWKLSAAVLLVVGGLLVG